MGKQKVSQADLEKCGLQKKIAEIDGSKTPLQRTLEYLSQVENPHSFNMQGYHVELEWADTNITLQNRLEEIFASV